jgi:hypothetical protein
MVTLKRSNVQTTIYKTLHRKRETQTPLFKPGVSSGAPESNMFAPNTSYKRSLNKTVQQQTNQVHIHRGVGANT